MNRFSIVLFSLLLSISSVSATTFTKTANYGLENILYTIFLFFHSIVWFYIFLKTKPFEIKSGRYLYSFINGSARFMSCLWLFTIFYMSKGIILISSSPTFLEDKLFIFNVLYFITFVLLSLIIIFVLIKHSAKISGLSDFLSSLMYEVKYGE